MIVRLMALTLLAGCGAEFIDLRPPGAPSATRVSPSEAPATAGRLHSSGVFEGRAGHAGRGGARLLVHDGGVEIVLEDDFAVGGVSGPVVLLSDRADLGNALEAADMEVAPLQKISGRQSYFAMGLAPKKYAWVWCKPFRVEVARAALEAR